MKRLIGLLALALSASACATGPQQIAACPAGESEIRIAQLFLAAPSTGRVSDHALRRFVDKEITPRFPDGVSVVSGGPQWTGKSDGLIRDSAKVVLIALPASGDAHRRVEQVRAAYRARFGLESFVAIPPATCMAT